MNDIQIFNNPEFGQVRAVTVTHHVTEQAIVDRKED